MKKLAFCIGALCCVLVAALVLSTQWACVPATGECKEAKEVDDLKAELEKTKTDYDEKLKQLKDENDAMKAQLDEMDKSHTSLQELIDKLNKDQAQAANRLEMVTGMLSKFKSLIEAGKLRIKIRNGKMVLVLPSAVLFKSGKANLSKSGEETLAEVAPVLASIEGREFQVAGHTDDQPILKSEFLSNWQLSTARALSVVQFLQDKGVPPENLSAAGYSEYQPVAKNVVGQGKGANRRIEIILMPNLDELPNMNELKKVLGESGGEEDEAEAEDEAKTEDEAKAKPKAKAEDEAKTEDEAKAKPKAKAEAKAKPKAKAKAEAKPKAKDKAKPKPKPKPKGE